MPLPLPCCFLPVTWVVCTAKKRVRWGVLGGRAPRHSLVLLPGQVGVVRLDEHLGQLGLFHLVWVLGFKDLGFVVQGWCVARLRVQGLTEDFDGETTPGVNDILLPAAGDSDIASALDLQSPPLPCFLG